MGEGGWMGCLIECDIHVFLVSAKQKSFDSFFIPPFIYSTTPPPQYSIARERETNSQTHTYLI